jgi:STE24 endopeptidase
MQAVLLLGAGAGMFALIFGYVSRKFERQADVFAARVMRRSDEEAERNGDAASFNLAASPFVSPPLDSQAGSSATEAVLTYQEPVASLTVGRHGAAVFCSALERVAAVNNIPIAARSWCHGSIAKRIRFLEFLARDGERTAEFDRFMRKLYLTLGLGLVAFGVWTAIVAKMWM